MSWRSPAGIHRPLPAFHRECQRAIRVEYGVAVLARTLGDGVGENAVEVGVVAVVEDVVDVDRRRRGPPPSTCFAEPCQGIRRVSPCFDVAMVLMLIF